MESHAKLFKRLFILLLPFFVLFAIYARLAQSPYDIQHHVLEDKIQRLITPDPKNPKVIFAGESRAEYSIIPNEFTRETGYTSANIAVGEGVLSEMYDSLLQAGALNQHRIIIISVSSYEINDHYFDDQPIYWSIIYQEPFGPKKMGDLVNYVSLLASSHFDDFRHFLRRDKTDRTHMSSQAFKERGYIESSASYTPSSQTDFQNPWYTNIITDGLKQKEFVQAINGFGHTNDSIVIYNGPIAPSWRKNLQGTPGPEAEQHFAQVIESAIKPYPNEHFIDFRASDIPVLNDSDFGDTIHLNNRGAPIFTHYLVEMLRQDGILR